jgi:dihydrofolate reductase
LSKPRIVFVVATDRRGVMGKDGALPWHLPADLAHFKRLTLEKPVVMGRKTYASIGKPLPRRLNIVLTRDPAFQAEGCTVVHGVGEALAAAGTAPEIAVIGGAEIFDAFAEIVDAVYLTRIDADIEGDTMYRAPAGREPARQEILGAHAADERNAHPMTFVEITYG